MSLEPIQIHAKQYSKGAFDRRRNLCDLPAGDRNDTYRRIAKSIAALMYESDLKEENGVTVLKYPNFTLEDSLGVEKFNREYGPVADDFPFKDEPESAYGSGFLVGKRLLATAAHCILESDDNNKYMPDKIMDLNTIRVVFDYCMEIDPQNNNQKCNPYISVYKVIRVVAKQYKEGICDWALVELEKDVEKDREPLIVETDPSKVAKEKGIYTIGHPSGLPQKFTDDGIIKDVTEGRFFQHIWHNLDTFSGNSGSAVFCSESDKILGIHISTAQWFIDRSKNSDYILNEEGKMVVRRVTDDEIRKRGGRCEYFQKMTPLVDIINAYNDGADENEIKDLEGKAKGFFLPYARDVARRLQHSDTDCVRRSGRNCESSVDSLHYVSSSCAIQ